ncbi:hypothetical protein [Vibrio parahaemolyticus]|uniref:hypothetical protein n=1 Tax=Vibrio parahaemolyticus TaxID=670 RepID=UPI00226ACEC3|nr:hypothetical protein [Vibrio parahaemolyticus]MCX8796276.1 hypothetical protein [Vibrio parahaemolyticus]
MKSNMKSKIIALSIAFASASSFANGGSLDKVGVFDDAYSGFQLLRKPHSQQEKIVAENTKEENDLLLSSLQSLSVLNTEHSQSEVEDAIFYIMTTQHEELKSKWDDNVTFNGIKIYQDDNMVNYEQYSFDPETPMVNKNRIKNGLPPVSYDGLPIQICALTKNVSSSKFEILSTQVDAFINLSRSGLSKEQACLSESDAKSYWVERQKDFVDQYLNYTPRYRYE